MNPPASSGRFRAYIEFILAVIYYFAARLLVHQWALQIRLEQGSALAEQAALAILLLFGFALMGLIFNRQQSPLTSQGWPLRQGFLGEIGLGLAVGWGLAVACILPLVVFGGIEIRISGDASSWHWLAADFAYFAVLAVVEEVAFRGYAFQRFAAALGGLGAAFAFSAFYAIVQNLQPGSSSASVFVSIVFGLLLSTAYLRARALWLSWGLNFAWKASRALLFGLAISGDNSHSSVIQGDPMGPFWITGGGYGVDGTWITFILVVVALALVYRLTRDLDFQWNAPVIVAGGVPVDLDAAARRQHDAAMGTPELDKPSLVQIQPIAHSDTPPRSPFEPPESSEASNDSH